MGKSGISKIWERESRLGPLGITILGCLAIGGWSLADHYAKEEVRGKIEACLSSPNSTPETQITCIKQVMEDTKPRLTGCAGLKE